METIRMSSKGQIVIPQRIREELHAEEGTMFTVLGSKNAVILKKLDTPSKIDLLKELEHIAKTGKHRLQQKGIRELDIHTIVEKRRKKS